MSIKVETRTEGKRCCGYRKPGGIYLVGPPFGMPCCKLPFPLTTCPCCGAGIRPARGWTWVDVGQLITGICTQEEITPMLTVRRDCPLANPEQLGKAGLIWVGEQFYKTPEDFLAEARTMGICRRITNIPREFKLGETWVLLAHRKAIATLAEEPELLLAHRKAIATLAEEPEPGELVPTNKYQSAIFSVFRPIAIEYVIKGDETQEELEKIVNRGMTPVNVNPRRAYHEMGREDREEHPATT
jgi:hypothetical protein